MLLFTVVTALVAWVAGVAAAAVESTALPAYYLNVAAPRVGRVVFESALVPALFSHFRGDALTELDAADTSIVHEVPSTFMDDRGTAIVIVRGFDEARSEAALGSAPFYLSREAESYLETRSTAISLPQLEALDETEHVIVRIDAVRNGIDYLDNVLQALQQSAAKTLLIGVPRANPVEVRGNVAADSARRNSFTRAAKNRSTYVAPADFFDSKEECESATNQCTGRGECVKTANSLFACRCKPTKTNAYTYYWGGNDCSKRDISLQFNLIVGTTVAIVVAAVLSVGLLFRLGSQPLPGVLDTSTL